MIVPKNPPKTAQGGKPATSTLDKNNFIFSNDSDQEDAAAVHSKMGGAAVD